MPWEKGAAYKQKILLTGPFSGYYWSFRLFTCAAINVA